MTAPARVAACLLTMLVLALFAGSPAVQAYTIKSQAIDIKTLFQAIAREAKVNIILDKGIRGTIPVELVDVDPLEAMRVIAAINKLKVREVQAGGARKTFVVADENVIEAGFDKANSKIFQLSFAKAADMSAILAKGLGKAAKVNVEVDDRTNSVLVNGTKDVIDKVEILIKELDKPVPQVIIDSKVVQVQTNFARNLGFLWDWGTDASAAGRADGVNIQAPGSGNLFAITEFQRKNFNANLFEGGATGVNFFSFGDFFRGNFFFDAAFQALETSSIARTLASPRVLAINGAKAELRIGDKVIFSGGPSQPPEERDTGTNLDITPRINKDGFITMDIEVTQSAVSSFQAGFPTINQIRSKTTVQVRDGEEVLVGGLVSEASSPSTQKIPFLGDIPLVKHFFTLKQNNPSSRELVILITPKLVKQQIPGGSVGEVTPPVAPSTPAGNGSDIFGGGEPFGDGDLPDIFGDGGGGGGAGGGGGGDQDDFGDF